MDEIGTKAYFSRSNDMAEIDANLPIKNAKHIMTFAQYFVSLITFFCLSFSLNGQYNVDQRVESKPHELQPYFPEHDTSGMKSVAIITVFDSLRRTVNDTSYYNFYNTEGHRIIQFGYDDGIRRDTLYSSYSEDGNSVRHYNPLDSSKTQREYFKELNDKGRPLKKGFIDCMKGGTFRNEHVFYYENEQLTCKHWLRNEQPYRVDSLHYKDDLLLEYRALHKGASAQIFSTKYQYDTAGYLFNRQVVQEKPSSFLFENTDFTYTDGRIIRKSIIEKNGQPIKHELKFEYYEDGKIKRLEARKDDNYRYTDYFYKNNVRASLKLKATQRTVLGLSFTFH